MAESVKGLKEKQDGIDPLRKAQINLKKIDAIIIDEGDPKAAGVIATKGVITYIQTLIDGRIKKAKIEEVILIDKKPKAIFWRDLIQIIREPEKIDSLTIFIDIGRHDKYRKY